MVIDVNKLKGVGVTVRVFERTGKGNTTQAIDLRDPFIEVFFEHGRALSDGITEGVREMVQSKVYATALIENIALRVHQIQLMEAIAATEDSE